MTNNVAFICARAGSKGLPSKNTRDLLGKPLCAWSIRQAQESRVIDEVCVSSDDPDVLAIAGDMGVECIIERPQEFCNDVVGKWSVWQHAISCYEEIRKNTCDVFIDLDCTSPLRDSLDIENCVAELATRPVDGVFTICEARKNPYFNLIEKTSNGFSICKQLEQKILSRQNAPPVFEHVASIYCLRREFLLTSTHLFDGDLFGYDIGQEKSFDIDNLFDFELIEWLMSRRNEI